MNRLAKSLVLALAVAFGPAAQAGGAAIETDATVLAIAETMALTRSTWATLTQAEHRLLSLLAGKSSEAERRDARALIAGGLGAELSRPDAAAIRLDRIDPARCAPDRQRRCEALRKSAHDQTKALIQKRDYVERLLRQPSRTVSLKKATDLSLRLSEDFIRAEAAYADAYAQADADFARAQRVYEGEVLQFAAGFTRLYGLSPVLTCAFAQQELDALAQQFDGLNAPKAAAQAAARNFRVLRIEGGLVRADPAAKALTAQIDAAIGLADRLESWRAHLNAAYGGAPCRFAQARDLSGAMRDLQRGVRALLTLDGATRDAYLKLLNRT